MIFETLLLLSIILAIYAIETKDMLKSILILGGLDIVVAALFYIMAAPDIAITQIAVTAGIGTFVLIVAVNRCGRKEGND
ncbi:MAG: DUF4040 domain-containing protein [Candidatus Aenigmarchaeota archaeon]|nr:DUF4040 domain-containing protein [Candidatus Aenigmarchaeota archaeon]